MQEQQPQPESGERGLRPILLIGGGATLVTLTLCAIIALAFAGVSLLSNRPDPDNATQVAVARGTPQNATSAAPTLTPLPAFPTRTPIAAPTTFTLATVTQNTGARIAPDQAVREYFNLVSQQRYDVTWNLLTDGFKQKFNCCAPGYDYTGYTGWWNSVDRVEFGTVNTVSQSGDRAVVYAELYFVMNDGQRSGVDSNPYIELSFDPFLNVWRFVDKRAAA